MNVLKKLFLFSVLALAVVWPLQPQRAGQTRRDREREPNVRSDIEPVPEAAQTQWAKHYDSIGATSIQQTADSGYVLAGYTGAVDYGFKWKHIRVLKLDSQGTVEWSTYLEEDIYWGGLNSPTDIVQTPDGGFVVGGKGDGAGGNWLIKLSSAGAIEWQKFIRRDAEEIASSLHLTRDGGFIIGGSLGGLLFMKLRSNGEVEWQKRPRRARPSEVEVVEDIVQTPDGGYIAVGATSRFINGAADLIVFKLNAEGGFRWLRCFEGTGGRRLYSVLPSPDGSFIAAGSTTYTSPGIQRDAMAVKLSSEGEIIWCKVYGGSTPLGRMGEISLTPDGGFVMACEGAILRLDAQGRIVWQRKYENFMAGAVKPASDGGFIFTGNYDDGDYTAMASTGAVSQDMYAYYGDIAVFKTDSQGLIEGCPLLRDPGITARSESLWRQEMVLEGWSAWGDFADFNFVPKQHTVVAETICIPYFDLTIAAGPGGTTKPEPATHAYASGSSVKVYALPDERHVFSFWSGDVPENKRLENPVRIDMDGDKSIKANFARPNFQLTIAAGDGGTTDPAPGSHTYAGDTIVRIEALPDASHVFTSWTGDVPDAKRGENPVMLEMDANKSVQADFAIKRILRLSAGTGGTTEPTPGVYGLPHGSTATVKAVPDSNHVFSQWTGDVSDARKVDNPLSVLMDIDRTLAANFLARIFAPLDLRGETQENRSLFTVEHINILTWRPNPQNTGISKYRVYELRAGNLVLLAEPPVGTETYWHRGVKEGNTYTYVVKAVGSDGLEGEPATVTITVS